MTRLTCPARYRQEAESREVQALLNGVAFGRIGAHRLGRLMRPWVVEVDMSSERVIWALC